MLPAYPALNRNPLPPQRRWGPDLFSVSVQFSLWLSHLPLRWPFWEYHWQHPHHTGEAPLWSHWLSRRCMPGRFLNEAILCFVSCLMSSGTGVKTTEEWYSWGGAVATLLHANWNGRRSVNHCVFARSLTFACSWLPSTDGLFQESY